MHRIVFGAAALLLCVPVLGAQQPEVGKKAPQIEGIDLDGRKFKLSDYKGKVVLLDFWGHW